MRYPHSKRRLQELAGLNEAEYNNVFAILQWESPADNDPERFRTYKAMAASMSMLGFKEVDAKTLPGYMRIRRRGLPAVFWKGPNQDSKSYKELEKVVDQINGMHPDANVIIQFQ